MKAKYRQRAILSNMSNFEPAQDGFLSSENKEKLNNAAFEAFCPTLFAKLSGLEHAWETK